MVAIKKYRTTIIGLGAIAAIVSGCGSNKITTSSTCLLGKINSRPTNIPKPLEKADKYILGGTTAPSVADDRTASTVVVRTGFKTGVGICGGVYVAPGLVLTAAHCVKPTDPTLQVTNVSVGFGTNRTSAKYLPATSVAPHPSFPEPFLIDGVPTGDDNGNQIFTAHFDIAVITVDAPEVPATYKPVPVWTDNAKLRPKDPLTFSGWGRTMADNPNSITTDLMSVASRLSRVGGSLPSDPPNGGMLVVGPSPGIGVCQGDSGGPAHIKAGGRWFALGLTQGFDSMYFPGLLGWSCETGAALFTSIGHHKAWIETTAKVSLQTQETFGITTIDDQSALEPVGQPKTPGSTTGEDDGC